MEGLETKTIDIYEGPEKRVFREPTFMSFMRSIGASEEDSSYDSKYMIKYFNWKDRARICYQRKSEDDIIVKVSAESKHSHVLESLKRIFDIAVSIERRV